MPKLHSATSDQALLRAIHPDGGLLDCEQGTIEMWTDLWAGDAASVIAEVWCVKGGAAVQVGVHAFGSQHQLLGRWYAAFVP